MPDSRFSSLKLAAGLPALFALSLALSACGGGGGGSTAAAPAPAPLGSYSVGGTITYLDSDFGDVVLTNTDGDGNSETVTVTGGTTTFTFATDLQAASTYSVSPTSYTVDSKSNGWACKVTGNGNGTVASADITDVAVTCGRDIKLTQYGGYVQSSGTNQGVITLLYQASDSNDTPITGLETDSFVVTEDGNELSSEAFIQVVPKTGLDYEIRTVVMLDISSSIGVDENLVANDELQQVKDAAKSIIINSAGNSVLLPNQRIALYVFDGNVTLLQPFTDDHILLADTIDAITQAGRADLSSTNLYGAVYEGLQQWSNQFSVSGINTGFLVVITDGAHTSGGITLDEVTTLRDIGEKQVFAIGLGDISQTAAEALDTIGNAGSFNNINFDDLGNTLNEISQQLNAIVDSFYFLNFASTQRQDLHTVALETAGNVYSGPGFSLTGQYTASNSWGVDPTLQLNGDLNVIKGTSNNLTASLLWDIPATPSYTWTSDNTLTAIVSPSLSNSSSATLSGIEYGTAQLTIDTTSFFGNAITETVNVNVTDVEIKGASSLMSKGQSNELTATSINLTPNFNWSSSGNCNLLTTLGDTTTLTAGGVDGTCTVRLRDTSIDGSGIFYTLKITVGAPGTTAIAITEQGGGTVTSTTNYDFEDNFIPSEFASSGDANWTIFDNSLDTSNSSDYSISSGAITDNETSGISLTTGDVTTISFDVKTSTEDGWDYLEFYIDGILYDRYSGENDWSTVTATIPNIDTAHTFTWIYDKDGDLSTGDDTVWIDNIEFQ